jgi:hypothetical protein
MSCLTGSPHWRTNGASGVHPYVVEVHARSLEESQEQFGRHGQRALRTRAGGDDNPVLPNRPMQSISAEDTLEANVLLAEIVLGRSDAIPTAARPTTTKTCACSACSISRNGYLQKLVWRASTYSIIAMYRALIRFMGPRIFSVLYLASSGMESEARRIQPSAHPILLARPGSCRPLCG